MLLLDNCANNKTSKVLSLINSIEIPTLYSAPASYSAVPIERFFGAIKSKNYEEEEVPDILKRSLPLGSEVHACVNFACKDISIYLFTQCGQS